MRPLVPLAMIAVFVSNLFALVFQPTLSHESSILFLSGPYNQFLFTLQLLFYVLAFLGNRLNGKGLLGKIIYVPTFLVNSNLSAIRGLITFFTGEQSVLWERTRRRGEPVG